MTAAFAGRNKPERVTQPFRSDVLGLRGVAVLSLVLFHYGFPLGGGFTAVDVLLVLSGFTIGATLWHEYETTGEIWLPDFLKRRATRLLPGLLIVLIATAALGWLLLLPDDFATLGLATAAAALQVSNLLFWIQGDYFSALSETRPLLHTWFLGAAIQAILVVPLVFRALGRNERGLIWGLGGLCMASLAACIAVTPFAPEAAFFLFPFRLWEVLAGVLLAILLLRTGHAGRGPAMLSWLGALLIAASLTLTPAGALYPGTVAVVPAIGTLLLLSGGRGRNPVNQALAHNAARLLGQIAYPLFLWHWPILVLGTELRGGDIGWPERICLLLVSLVLAWLTMRLLRWTRTGPARRRAVTGATTGLGIGSAVLAGLSVPLQDGLPQRFGTDAMIHITAMSETDRTALCETATEGPLMGLELCRIGPEGPTRALVWGDESAANLISGLDDAAWQQSIPTLILMRSGCPPLFGLRKTDSKAGLAADTACMQANTQIRQALGRLQDIETVLLVGRWAFYASGTGHGLDSDRTVTLHAQDTALGGLTQPRLVARAARNTVNTLQARLGAVHVLRQPPEMSLYDARRAAKAAARAGLPFAASQETSVLVPREALALRAALADAPWLLLAERGEVTVIDPWELACDDRQCAAIRNGVGLYSDNARLSQAAGRLLTPYFANALALPAPATALSSASRP